MRVVEKLAEKVKGDSEGSSKSQSGPGVGKKTTTPSSGEKLAETARLRERREGAAREGKCALAGVKDRRGTRLFFDFFTVFKKVSCKPAV